MDKKTCVPFGNATQLLLVFHQAPVVQKVDDAIHRINHFPLDIAIGFAITYPVDSAVHRLNNWSHMPMKRHLQWF